MLLENKIREATSLTLYKYWNELRGDRKAPHRFEIEPARISPILSQTFILENERTDTYEFRLAGTQICQQFGMELKHQNLLSLWTEHDREAMENLLFCVAKDAAIGVCDFTAMAANGRNIEFEMLLLPLMHNDFAITRMVGTITAKARPYWLGISPLEHFRLAGVRLFWPDQIPDFRSSPQEIHHSNVLPLPTGNYKIVVKNDRKFKVYEGGREDSERN